ncbi:MAG: hypothetical protein IT260_00470 [Saprospiraceae bacterium]|nr:hypothetical protein [Saprospiraceae bacterium]
MLASKFYSLLSRLQEEDIAAFRKYLQQVHGKKKTALRLFDYIRKVHKKPRAAKNLELDFAYQKIYRQDIGENRKNMLNTLSDLYLWLKEFLLWQKAKLESIESRALWLSVLREKGLDTEFSKHACMLRDDLARQPRKAIGDYLGALIASHFIHFETIQDKASAHSGYAKDYLTELNLYNAISTLKVACEILTIKDLRPAGFNTDLWPNEMLFSSLPVLSGHPLLELYQLIHRLIKTREEEVFHICVARLAECAAQINSDELNTVFLYLNNYASSQVRKGNKSIWGHMHSLNQIGIEHKIFTRSGEMSIAQFQNIVNTACKAGDFSWVKSFFTTQSEYLNPELRKDAQILTNAMVAAERNDFALVVRTLKEATPKDIQTQIRTKALLLIGYYETEDPEVDLYTFCANFEFFLKRHQGTMFEAVQGTLQFVRFTKNLLQKQLPKEKLIETIQNAGLLYFRPWLLEKAAKYKQIIAARKQRL